MLARAGKYAGSMVSRQTRWAVGAAVVAGGAAVLASGVDQGSMLRTLVPLRRPRRGLEGYEGDLEFLRQAVRRHEFGITPDQLEGFNSVLETRRANSLDELVLTSMAALAVFDNAATTVLVTQAHRLPIRFGWMRDSLVVVKAAPEYAELAGQRVKLIGGAEPSVTWPLFAPFVGGGTPAWLRNRSAWFFSVPEALRQVGVGVHEGVVRLDLEAEDGTESVVSLRAEDQPMPGGPMADFRDRFPGDEGLGTRGWMTALRDPGESADSPDREGPLYLQHWDRLLFTRDVDLPTGGQALYVRILGTPDGADPSSEDIDDTIARVETGDHGRFIVDMRYACGGDYRVTLPLVKTIARQARERHLPIRLLVGPNLLGGGLISASQFLAHAPERTIVIGNDLGDRLRNRSQGRTVTLPHSGMLVQLCHDWHDVSTDAMPWSDVWAPDKFLLMGVGDFRPDKDVQNGWRDYLHGVDRLVEAALA